MNTYPTTNSGSFAIIAYEFDPWRLAFESAMRFTCKPHTVALDNGYIMAETY